MNKKPAAGFTPSLADTDKTDPALSSPGPAGLGALEPLLRDPAITEIMVNDLRNVMIEKDGKTSFSGLAFRNPRELDALVRAVCSLIGKEPTPERPFVDGSLPDGTRVHLIIPPAVPSGPCITLRRFPKTTLSLEDLVKGGMLDARMARFLAACATAKMNILIAGGTGAGKTTLLNAVLAYIPRQERIVTIEDTAELRVPHSNQWDPLESTCRHASLSIL